MNRGFCYGTKSLHEKGKTKRNCRLCKAFYARRRRLSPIIKAKDKVRNASVYGTPAELAKRIVFVKVRAGIIKRPDSYNCIVCGDKASVYDHRDYSKPLDVDPVCRSCNSKLGPGLNSHRNHPITAG